MAVRLWILRRSSGRSVRNEWAATRRLRSYATLVGARFSRDSARLFSTGQHNWHDRLLDGRTLGSGGHPLFSLLAPRHPAWHLPRESDQSSLAWREFPKIHLPLPCRYWSVSAASSHNRSPLIARSDTFLLRPPS